MSLADLIRSGVATADAVTASLQATVAHEAWTGHDATGKATYAAAVNRAALVERKTRQFRAADGSQVASRAKLTFPRAIAATGAAHRREPFDPRDRLTLPSGETGPILAVEGVVDPSTGYEYLFEVWLG